MTIKSKEDSDIQLESFNNSATAAAKNHASNKIVRTLLDLNAPPQEYGFISPAQERQLVISKMLKVFFPNLF